MSIPGIDWDEPPEPASEARRIALPKRVPLIDGLRGVAALVVALSHFNDRLKYDSWFGLPIDRADLFGVPLLFVVSGFVIAMSLADKEVDATFLWRFGLRRLARLSAPYWLSMAAIVLIGTFGAQFGAHATTPSVGAVAAHLFYLQNILHVPAISPIYWTLCYEIQFYLFLALLVGLAQRGLRLAHLAIATSALSLLCRDFSLAPSWCINFWFCFASGAMTFWYLKGKVSIEQWGALTVLIGVNSLATNDLWGWAALISSTLIIACANRLTLLGGRVPQFFGRISYSLYLTHAIFGWYALSVALKFAPRPVALLVGVLASVASAYVWYVLFEKPSIELSRKIPLTNKPRRIGAVDQLA